MTHGFAQAGAGPLFPAGVALFAISLIGMGVLSMDDITGIGVADDFLIGPVSAGISQLNVSDCLYYSYLSPICTGRQSVASTVYIAMVINDNIYVQK